jgi:Na+/proline symporter
VIKEFMPQHRMSQKKLLWVTRTVVFFFTLLVIAYSLWALDSETSIHQMVENAYKVTLACAFVPLVAGLYWKRASNTGAALSIVLGLAVWIGMEIIDPEAVLPPQFAGFFASAVGMIAGSLASPSRHLHHAH